MQVLYSSEFLFGRLACPIFPFVKEKGQKIISKKKTKKTKDFSCFGWISMPRHSSFLVKYVWEALMPCRGGLSNILTALLHPPWKTLHLYIHKVFPCWNLVESQYLVFKILNDSSKYWASQEDVSYYFWKSFLINCMTMQVLRGSKTTVLVSCKFEKSSFQTCTRPSKSNWNGLGGCTKLNFSILLIVFGFAIWRVLHIWIFFDLSG